MRGAAFEALEAVYRDLAAELARLGPECWSSGNCCRFEKAGHRLYTTPLELEYLRAKTGFRGADRGKLAEGSCPFLREGRCGVRDHRMLGCRIYYCDPRYAPHMAGVYERFHARVKEVMREHGVPYEYFDYLGRMREMSLVNGVPGGFTREARKTRKGTEESR